MANFTGLVELIKKVALSAVEAAKPVAVMYGTVTELDPLTVNVEQKITLTAAQLVMTKTFAENMPENGSGVILLRVQGGQKFVILDVTGGETGGEEADDSGE